MLGHPIIFILSEVMLRNSRTLLYLLSFQLVMEGIRARQQQDALLKENQTLEKAIQETKATCSFYELKVGRIDDQVYIVLCSTSNNFCFVGINGADVCIAVKNMLRPSPEACRR